MRSAFTLIAALFLMLTPAAAQAPTAAESFVAKTVGDGFAIINNTGLSQQARTTQLESLLLAATDLRLIALFTLGDAKVSDAQRDAFVAAFRSYALSVYRTHLTNYAGKSLTVTGSRPNASGDVVVRGVLNDPNGGNPVSLEFRVRTTGPAPVILDIGFTGGWLAVTQHDDFAAFLARNKGDVSALTAWLESRAR